jgi:hypothetical protein
MLPYVDTALGIGHTVGKIIGIQDNWILGE